MHLLPTTAHVLADVAPAGGAAIGEVVLATAFGLGGLIAVVAMCVLHRSGRTTLLARAAHGASRLTGLPGWAALPTAVGAISLHVALLGMYWDIALHIDRGRDEGPLANPAHYLILIGLFGIFAAGLLAMALPARGEKPGPASLRLGRGWHAPVGGLLIAACGGFALAGFPLDDGWHRLFGQDVTLWGPTHLMLIGGAGLSLVGLAVLLVEGMATRGTGAPRTARGGATVQQIRRITLMGGLLIGLSTFQAEFDFGVPQYRAVMQPIMLAIAGGLALVAARLWLGRGGALGAVLAFWVIRGIVSVTVGPVLGQTTPALPLYLGAAVTVELAALALASARRPLVFGAVAGGLAGTVGLLGEWAWSQVAMPLEWTADLVPEAFGYGLVAGVASGLAGALLALGLQGRLPSVRTARVATAGSLLTIAAVVAVALPAPSPENASVIIETRPVGNGDAVMATVRVLPPALARQAAWATVTSWQGGGRRVVDLVPAGDGTLRTATAVPVTGSWKSIVRIAAGRAVIGAPLSMPADAAIGAEAVLAPVRAERPLIRDTEVLQRERDFDAPGWLWGAASGLVLALYASFVAALAWGVARVGRRIAALPPARPAARDAAPVVLDVREPAHV